MLSRTVAGENSCHYCLVPLLRLAASLDCLCCSLTKIGDVMFWLLISKNGKIRFSL